MLWKALCTAVDKPPKSLKIKQKECHDEKKGSLLGLPGVSLLGAGGVGIRHRRA
jgi:hypothetical protein